ncbi:hypothetical protein [Microlunatus flavus]|uniref:Uncharacterized protein n=1 Tax=Microlunatus flavus TaxID=1036181 RepID=A0A1H9NLB0_9ACTN|nr:hypothetical protein [Microlunatus flavus]SER36682.1 hypothetical protein SAMN05421756_11616 [Microlunatus flavus]
MIREQWDGGEWQEHCCQLLSMRYGTDVQIIPDRDRGDGGLEAYHFDGTGYQCYAPQEAYNTTALTDAQKVKISTDIAKLDKDPARTKRLLGSITLRRWVLLTPNFDSKELVMFARDKSEKVRKHPRPSWCHETFEIVVSDDSIFAREVAQLYERVHTGVDLDIPDPSGDDIFAATSGGMADRLTDKLLAEPHFAADADRLGRYKSTILSDYVRGCDQFSELESRYPTMYASVQRRLKSTLRGLARELEGTLGAGPVVIDTLQRRLEQNLQQDAPGLSPVLCHELARYAIALWLVECPLYFPAAA